MKTFEDVKKYIMSVELSTISDDQEFLDKPLSKKAHELLHTTYINRSNDLKQFKNV